MALGLTPSLPLFVGLPEPLRRRVDEALEAHDLVDLRDRRADALSGGERSRAMLARAAVGDPQILIVDEPTAGLDPRHALDAIRRLRAHADRERSVIMAIHDLDLAVRAADEVLALKDGRILAAGPVEAVVHRGDPDPALRCPRRGSCATNPAPWSSFRAELGGRRSTCRRRYR